MSGRRTINVNAIDRLHRTENTKALREDPAQPAILDRIPEAAGENRRHRGCLCLSGSDDADYLNARAELDGGWMGAESLAQKFPNQTNEL